MGDLGRTLREAREQAGLSLSGMAKRTGYSRGYIGNVETGVRAVTPDVIKKYESVLGEDLKRRQLLLGTISALAAGAAPDTASSIANDINGGRTGMLTGVQTTHATDRAVASLVARNAPSIASLAKWCRSGKAVLRVNSAGILAKVGSPVIDNEAISVLRADAEVRELYLTAVLHRVLGLDWNVSADLAAAPEPFSTDQLMLLQAELSNPHDSGARYCSVLLLTRNQRSEPEVTAALLSALRSEASRENLRAIGAALAGVNPLKI
ncbi:helix-turn-helix transcriptional regulator [Micromonospora sp. NPDC049230]|uniref:helix-turn-helix domain-containing protein n=1 Tax=Micromonospora sp. NPDC049230 TaxID=3155502 RepID=UPI00340D5A33